MSNFDELEMVIDTDGSPIDVEEFTEFLYHFRAVYSVAISELRNKPYLNQSELNKAIRNRIAHSDWKIISDYAHAELGVAKLGIINLKRENPLTIIFSGIAIALTAAVIVSGGSLKMGPLSVKLPPLGKGVKELRAAFGQKPRANNKKEI